MKNTTKLFSVLCVAAIQTSAFASGFKCEGDMGYNVKLYNDTSSTRTPAVLVISQVGQGTLLTREGTEISKHNRPNTVQYVVEGNRKLDADMRYANSVGARGTPTSFVNGKLIPGAQPYETFKKLVDEELSPS